MILIQLPETQREAQPREWKQVADITAEAFAEDPVNRWVFGSPRAIQSTFRVLIREIYMKQGRCFLAGDNGATTWLEPGVASNFSTWAMIQFALGQMRYGKTGAIRRATALGDLMAQHHPTEPHMYLFTIGTRQSARGKGLGKALLRPVLEACDRDGIPVYLENSNPVNSGFYTAHGFERIGLFNVGDGGPVMEPMWRAPKEL
ncbi:MAG: GNAT family N-acetyltransferase [Henriciella sp.]|nr:GNAT family N-acetyltransferase [Henriciella sp.]